MIRRAAKLQVLAFLVVGFIGVAYVGVTYVGLGDRLLGRGYVVYADFAEAGGIFANAPVTYRGVPVGRVDDVTLHDGGARVRMRLDDGVRVSRDTRAVVGQRSAVGEQFLDLRPETDAGPYLTDGSVVPRSRTGIPLAPETLLANLDALVRSVDPAALSIVIDELGTAFEGNERALRTILDAGDLLLQEATANLPQTVTLLRDGRTVLKTQEESAAAIRAWAKGLAQLAETVRSSDADLRRLIANGPPAAEQLVALLDGLEPTIGTLLGNLISVNGVAVRRLAGIEQVLVVYPMAVAGGFTVTPGDGTAHLGLVLNVDDPPSCKYGQTTRCSAADQARGSSVRGTNNAPRPGGSDPPPPGDPGALTGGIDPVSGLALGADGHPLLFGTTGGQYQLAGDQSWKQLLLAGLAP
ncbi:MCE family protein [Dactylosporangium sucinum]|uniref:ABC transporter substrate-binding protein n=1 Tax=Dactylosporangium sucinum TaxID=1424081 RepID=A0A917UF43_9ACTN|nr:MlaD family protein [Dactylosporangium sucinum]GGM78544.1 ABC transporter substrate-binding protein [Dactylosporangium sucinum]